MTDLIAIAYYHSKPIRFKLDRPHKWTVLYILKDIGKEKSVRISQDIKLTKKSSLREIIKAAKHIEDTANEKE